MKSAAPQTIDFEFPPEVGTVVMFHGQRYELVGTKPYVRKDGTASTLIVWSTHCARCADPMECTTPIKGWPNRRCPDCAQKGVRV